jgi:HK97 family phage major capsid protein
VDELLRKLQETRTARLKAMREAHTASAESLAAGKPKEERAAFDAAYQAAKDDIAELDIQISRHADQLAAEKRSAELAAATGATGDQEGRASGVQVTNEPTMYGRYSGRSFFLDMARANPALGNDPEARSRLDRHRTELDVELPKRRDARAKAATLQLERRMARSPREERAYDRFLGQGGKAFQGGSRESRALSRTDGQGGFFVPPLWLVDDYIPFLRAGRTFADLWMNLPLPSGTDSINIPRVVLGAATGPQTSDGQPLVSRDIQDNFVNALVRTIAGQQDAALQLLDQSPVAYDQILFKDLMADYAMNLSGQLMLGSGVNGQLTGLYPTGVLGSSSGPSSHGFVVNNAATVWTSPTAVNFYQSAAQIISKISRSRFRRPTDVVTNDAAWFGMASSTDSQGRPLVVATAAGLGYNQSAGEDGAQNVEGPVGHIFGVPWSADPNIPLTFGGATTAPSIGAISQGNVAPIDGTGSGNTQTPAIAMVADDLFLWEGELRTRTLSEVLSGTLQIRFQVYGYAASMPNRYQDSSGNLLSYGNYNTVGTVGGILSTGTAGGLINF